MLEINQYCEVNLALEPPRALINPDGPFLELREELPVQKAVATADNLRYALGVPAMGCVPSDDGRDYEVGDDVSSSSHSAHGDVIVCSFSVMRV